MESAWLNRHDCSLPTTQRNCLAAAQNKSAWKNIDRPVVFLAVKLNRGNATVSRQMRTPAHKQQKTEENGRRAHAANVRDEWRRATGNRIQTESAIRRPLHHAG
jgi:hypothetical protein